MLNAYQHTFNQCVAQTGGTYIKRKSIKIVDTNKNDFFKQLFLTDKITIEQWQLITNIRRLAFCARRSQGIRMHLQSHSKYWGMPLVFADDGYINSREERRWKLFLFYLKPFIDHQWLNKDILELLLFGGYIVCEDNIMGRPAQSDAARLGVNMDALNHMLLVIEYIWEKVYRKR